MYGVCEGTHARTELDNKCNNNEYLLHYDYSVIYDTTTQA